MLIERLQKGPLLAGHRNSINDIPVVHQRQFPHVIGHGKVYICPIDPQYWRSTKRASDIFRPLDYR